MLQDSNLSLRVIWIIALLAIIGAVNLITSSQHFSSHFAAILGQSSSYMAMALFTSSTVVALNPTRLSIFVFLASLVVFLRVLALDGPALVAGLVICALLASGDILRLALTQHRSRGATSKDANSVQVGNRDDTTLYQSLILGIAAQAFVAALLSVFAIFTPFSMALFDGLCLLTWCGIKVATCQSIRWPKALNNSEFSFLAAAAPLAALGVILFARARQLPYADYDSFWYGLSIERTLAPGGAFWNDPGLASLVHYYPKLGEIVQFPLSVLPDYLFQTSLNVWFTIAIGFVVLREMVRAGVAPPVASLIACFIISAPAFAHVAAGTKGDVMSALSFTLALSFLGRYSVGRDAAWLGLTLICFLVMLSTKLLHGILVAMPAMVVFGVLCVAIVRHQSGWRLGTAFAVIGFGAAGLIAGRTWWLTGLPFVGPSSLVDLQKLIGFSPTPAPIIFETNLTSTEYTPALQRLVDIFFHADRMRNVSIGWPSFVVPQLLTMFLCSAAIRTYKISYSHVPLLSTILLVCASTSAFFLFADFYIYGGDGNYYILFGLAISALFWIIPTRPEAHFFRGISHVLSFLVLVQIIVASTATWAPGFGQPDWSFRGSTIQTPKVLNWWFQYIKLTPVVEYIRKDQECTMVTSREHLLLDRWILQQPCRVEMIDVAGAQVWTVRGRKAITRESDAAQAYLCTFRPKYILDGAADGDKGDMADKVLGLPARFPDATEVLVKSGEWTLYRLNSEALCKDLAKPSAPLLQN